MREELQNIPLCLLVLQGCQHIPSVRWCKHSKNCRHGCEGKMGNWVRKCISFPTDFEGERRRVWVGPGLALEAPAELEWQSWKLFVRWYRQETAWKGAFRVISLSSTTASIQYCLHLLHSLAHEDWSQCLVNPLISLEWWFKFITRPACLRPSFHCTFQVLLFYTQFKQGENNFLVWLLVMFDFLLVALVWILALLVNFGIQRLVCFKIFKLPGISVPTLCIKHTRLQ